MKAPGPIVEIHSELARDLDISDGDTVMVETRRGKIKVNVEISDVVHPKIVQMVNGWCEANMNILTDDVALDPISGFPPLRSIMCRITKVHPRTSNTGSASSRQQEARA